MSSQTPNLNLVLPVGTEKVSRQIINDNNTKIDTAVGANSTAIANVQNGLAYIVGNTNTTGATLAVGQFVYVKGHSTIAEGLRKVTASISANGNITTSNTTECSEGGLNALNSKLSIVTKTHTFSNVGAGAGTWETIQLSVPSGKTLLMASVYQTSGLNLAPVWIKAVGSSTADVMVWNGRTGAADVGVTVVGLCW